MLFIPLALLVLAGLAPLGISVYRLVRDWNDDYRYGQSFIEFVLKNEPALQLKKRSVLALLALVGASILPFLWNLTGDYLWFSEEMHQPVRFAREWAAFLNLLGIGLGTSTIVWLGLIWVFERDNRRAFSTYTRVALLLVGTVPPALFYASSWEVFLPYVYRVPAGTTDPIFGNDISFYLFTVPWLRSVWYAGVVFAVVPVITAIVLAVVAYNDSDSDSRQLTLGLRVAIGIVLMLLAYDFFLAQYELLFSAGDEGVLHGVSYTDEHARAPLYLAMVFFLVAVAAWVAMTKRELRALSIPASVLVGSSVILLFAVPYLTWYINVRPMVLEAETPYIENTMTATKMAFGIDTITKAPFTPRTTLTAEDMEVNKSTLENVRIWDPRVLQNVLEQQQLTRGIYKFSDVDVDRYCAPGETVCQQVFIAPREINQAALPNNRINRRLTYTHGAGVVMVPVNRFQDNGKPVFLAQDVPTRVNADWLREQLGQEDMYFGHLTDEHVYVGTKEVEFDYARGDNDIANSRYAGTGGVALSSLWRKVSYGWKLDDSWILLSDQFADESRVLFRRNIHERVSSLAPFLTLGPDWYVVVANKRLYAMLDAYTTSGTYPNAEHHGTVNYIRNSVKAVVDMYDGTTTLYVMPQRDVIIDTYQEVYPGLFTPFEKMPAELQAHVRYPEALFKYQLEMYGRYHVENVPAFFGGYDAWTTPRELYYNGTIPVEPYYVTAELPGMEKPEFMLVRTFAFAKNQRMTAWVAALCDGANYGKLVAYVMPPGSTIAGPEQIEAQIGNHEGFANDFRNWIRPESGSDIIRGNLIILPLVGGQLMGFEPIYRTSNATAMPEMARVVGAQIMADTTKVVWGKTYEDSRAQLLRYAESVDLLADDDAGVLTDAELIQRVRGHLQQYRTFTGTGAFGDAGKELEQALQILEAHGEDTTMK